MATAAAKAGAPGTEEHWAEACHNLDCTRSSPRFVASKLGELLLLLLFKASHRLLFGSVGDQPADGGGAGSAIGA